MLEMGTSGLMSGEGKRVGYQSVPITRPSSTLLADSQLINNDAGQLCKLSSANGKSDTDCKRLVLKI